MTSTLVGADTNMRLRIRWNEPVNHRFTLVELAAQLIGVQDLLAVTHYILEPSPVLEDPRDAIRDSLVVERLTYQSPLDVALVITGAASSVVGAARGAVYLMSRWEDWREKRARVNLTKAATEFLREELKKETSAMEAPAVKGLFDLEGERRHDLDLIAAWG